MRVSRAVPLARRIGRAEPRFFARGLTTTRAKRRMFPNEGVNYRMRHF